MATERAAGDEGEQRKADQDKSCAAAEGEGQHKSALSQKSEHRR